MMNRIDVIFLLVFALIIVVGVAIENSYFILGGIIIAFIVRLMISGKVQTTQPGNQDVTHNFQQPIQTLPHVQQIGVDQQQVIIDPMMESRPDVTLSKKFTINEFRKEFPYLSNPRIAAHLSLRMHQVVNPELAMKIREDLQKFAVIMSTNYTQIQSTTKKKARRPRPAKKRSVPKPVKKKGRGKR